MKRKQVFATVTALCLTAALGIGATLAVLTRTSSQVTNTFSVGSGIKADAILLDEAKVVDKTVVTPETRVQENTYADIMQGDTLPKDPTVTVKADTADCYMFVKISGLDALAQLGITVHDWDSKWVKCDGSNSLDGLYLYGTGATAATIVTKSTADQVLPALFRTVDVADDAALYGADGSAISDIPQIKVKACAVQADNVATVAAAIAALPTTFTLN